jgi:predicted metalloprotease
VVAVVDSVQEFWTNELPKHGRQYSESPTYLFTGATQTACGQATSEVGPFYCPPDATVYIDLDFYNELQSRFGARGGPFAQAYVLAHEYGHHVQDLLSTLDRASGRCRSARSRGTAAACCSSQPGQLRGGQRPADAVALDGVAAQCLELPIGETR